MRLNSLGCKLAHRSGGTKRGGTASTIELHQLHHCRLDVVTASVEEESLAHDGNLLVDLARLGLVGQMDELRLGFTPPSNAKVRAHSSCLALFLAKDLARNSTARFLGNALGRIGEGFAVQNIVWGVDDIPAKRYAPGEALAGGDCGIGTGLIGNASLYCNSDRLEVFGGSYLLGTGAIPVVGVEGGVEGGRHIRQDGGIIADLAREKDGGGSHLLLGIALGCDGVADLGDVTVLPILALLAKTNQDVSLGFGTGNSHAKGGGGRTDTGAILEGLGVLGHQVGQCPSELLVKSLGRAGQNGGFLLLIFFARGGILVFILILLVIRGRSSNAHNHQVSIRVLVKLSRNDQLRLRQRTPLHTLAVRIERPGGERLFLIVLGHGQSRGGGG
mmetsp:Transcript_11031/g.30963  ORF Transcript_11031/g.30963 Transcript_11031/m.30963 type:complete len:388 (+) Transcript_11031:2177-3340(+)